MKSKILNRKSYNDTGCKQTYINTRPQEEEIETKKIVLKKVKTTLEDTNTEAKFIKSLNPPPSKSSRSGTLVKVEFKDTMDGTKKTSRASYVRDD